MKRWQKILIGLLIAIILLASVVSVGGSYWWANQMVNVPDEEFLRNFGVEQPPPIATTAAEYGVPNYEERVLTSQDGHEFGIIYFPSNNGAVIIGQHGLWANKVGMVDPLFPLIKEGYGVVLPDLRGHHQSAGAKLTFGRDEMVDYNTIMAFLRQREEVNPDAIGMYGESFGGAMVLLYAAENPNIQAVVAQSPYAHFPDQVKSGVEFVGLPAFPFAPLTQFFIEQQLDQNLDKPAFSPLAKIDEISPRPVLIMMGGRDTTVNPDGGRQLYAAAGEPRELWFDEELGHVEFQWRHREEFQQRLSEFFGQYLLQAEE